VQIQRSGALAPSGDPAPSGNLPAERIRVPRGASYAAQRSLRFRCVCVCVCVCVAERSPSPFAYMDACMHVCMYAFAADCARSVSAQPPRAAAERMSARAAETSTRPATATPATATPACGPLGIRVSYSRASVRSPGRAPWSLRSLRFHSPRRADARSRGNGASGETRGVGAPPPPSPVCLPCASLGDPSEAGEIMERWWMTPLRLH
jgi:hypothetical protein